MQLNKILLKVVLFFISNLVYSQPGLNKKLCNDPEIIFTINNSANKKIEFITKDSLNFYSLSKKYSFTLSIKEVRYDKFKTKDSIVQIVPMGMILKWKNLLKGGNTYTFSRNAENLDYDKYAFRLIFGVSQRERRSEPPYFYEYKSIVDINIMNNKKKMLVRLDFTKNLEKHFEEKKINLSINFQEGNFEVTDPLKPEIVRSKKSKL